MLVVGYVIGGAVLFCEWEGWRPLDSAYFCFITLTTIGFGDFVPKADQRVDKVMYSVHSSLKKTTQTFLSSLLPLPCIAQEVGIALCSLYLLFGMSLLVMTFNLVQQRVVDEVRRMALVVGIIKRDEDGGAPFDFE